MKIFILSFVLLITGSHTWAQSKDNLVKMVDVLYQTPLHKGDPGIAYWLLFKGNTELQFIGTAHEPAHLIELVHYPVRYRMDRVKGRVGFIAQYLPRMNKIALAGVVVNYDTPFLGGRLKGFSYLGIRPANGTWELLSPNNRLLWPVKKGVNIGLGFFLDTRGDQRTSFLVGPLLEWKHKEYTVRARFGEYLGGKAVNQRQIRVDLLRSF